MVGQESDRVVGQQIDHLKKIERNKLNSVRTSRYEAEFLFIILACLYHQALQGPQLSLRTL